MQSDSVVTQKLYSTCIKLLRKVLITKVFVVHTATIDTTYLMRLHRTDQVADNHPSAATAVGEDGVIALVPSLHSYFP